MLADSSPFHVSHAHTQPTSFPLVITGRHSESYTFMTTAVFAYSVIVTTRTMLLKAQEMQQTVQTAAIYALANYMPLIEKT